MFDLSPLLLSNLKDLEFHTPTPVQSEIIPEVLSGKDVVATAQTGSGKTAAFLLPIIKLLNDKTPDISYPRCLILTPTRELARQIAQRLDQFSNGSQLRYALIYGGVDYNKQIYYMDQEPDVLIATPGRLLDLVNRKVINLKYIEIFCLDEGDRMLDMGFYDDIVRCLKPMPKNRQLLLFSATMADEIQQLAEAIMTNPRIVDIDQPASVVENIDSTVYLVDQGDKFNLLNHMLTYNAWPKILIFANTRDSVDWIGKQLYKAGYKVGVIHSERTQDKRESVLKFFTEGTINILVATDVASRGIDIDDISHVINFDIPEYTEDYIHRVGRTGRAGRSGTALSFVAEEELRFLDRIEELIQQPIPMARSYRFKSRAFSRN